MLDEMPKMDDARHLQKTLDELNRMAADVQAAQQRIGQAQAVVDAERKRRAASPMARFAAMLSKNSGEALIDGLQASVTRTITEGTEKASAWFNQMVVNAVSADPLATMQYERVDGMVEVLTVQQDRVIHLKELTLEAAEAILDAQRACSTAGGLEVWDALSTSKLASFASSAGSCSASSEIDRAQRALERLEAALQTDTGLRDIEHPDDWLDLGIDLGFSPSLDVLSWLNLGRLRTVSRQLERAMEAVRELARELDHMAERVGEGIDQVTARVALIEKPFREAVMNMIPPVFRAGVHRTFETA